MLAGLAFAHSASAQIEYSVALVGVGTVPDFAYGGNFVVVRPGDRFTGGYGFGAEVEAAYALDSARWSIPLAVGYRSSAITEYTSFPTTDDERTYRSHHVYLRPAVRYRVWEYLSVDAGLALSYALTDPAETILEDYRGLTFEEQLLQPSFSDPVGVGGVYLNDYGVNFGPSVSLLAHYGRWSAFLRYDYLLGEVGRRDLREIDLVNERTTPLQQTTVSVKEWTAGVRFRL